MTFFDFAWGVNQYFDLYGVLLVSFNIDNLYEDRKYLVNVNLTLTFEAGGPETSHHVIFKNTLFPKQSCDWSSDFHISNFSYNKWATDRGHNPDESLPSDLLAKLLEETNLQGYLKEPQCELSTNWTKDCAMNMTLPPLSSDVSCHVTSLCTGIQCCVDNELLNRTLDFSILLDPCEKRLSISIEQTRYNTTFSNINWGVNQYFNLQGLIRIEYNIDDLYSERFFLVNARVLFCYEASQACSVAYTVLNNTMLPKVTCSWNDGFLQSGFSLSNWYTEHDQTTGDKLDDWAISVFLDDLGLSPFLDTSACNVDPSFVYVNNDSWTNECIKSVNLPSITTTTDRTRCLMRTSCTAVDCCTDVDFIPKSFKTYLHIDPCRQELVVGIEKYMRNISLSTYKWGTMAQFKLNGFIVMDYFIEELAGSLTYLVSLNISFCYNDGQPCNIIASVLENTLLPRDLCAWNTDYLIPGFSLNTWSTDNFPTVGHPLPEYAVELLFEQLGISQYRPSTQCSETALYMAIPPGEWLNACPLSTNIPDLDPSYTGIACHVTDMCTGVDCCVTSTVLDRSFNVKVELAPCDYILTIGIDDFVYSLSLEEFRMGEQQQFSLGGVVNIVFSVYDLAASNYYLMSMNITICTESMAPCEQTFIVLDNVLLPKRQCTWNATFVNPTFSLTNWMIKNGVTAPLPGFAIAILLDDLAVSPCLLSSSCDRGRSPYNKEVTDGWRNVCHDDLNVTLTPIAEDDHVTCVFNCYTSTCCYEVDGIGRSIMSSVTINTCKSEMRLTIERITQTVSLQDYNFGSAARFSLFGVFRIDYTIYDLESEHNYLIYMTLSTCFEYSGTCMFTTTIFNGFKLPKEICTSGTTRLDTAFDFDTWLASKDLSSTTIPLPEWAATQLVEELGVAKYVSTTECYDLKSPFIEADAENGWKNDCVNVTNTHVFDSGTSRLVCSIPVGCNGATCCMDIPRLNRSLEVSMLIEPCTNKLLLKIDKMENDLLLSDVTFGVHYKFSLYGIINIEYTIREVDFEDQYEVNMTLTVCFDSTTCEIEHPVFINTILIKEVCNWTSEFKTPDFSMSLWLSDRNLTMTSDLNDINADELLQDLGLTDFMGSTSLCDHGISPFNTLTNGWNNECTTPGIVLSSISHPAACHANSDCNRFSCCIEVGILKRSLFAAVYLNPCRYNLQVQLEQLTIDVDLFTYTWGERKQYFLYGVFRLEFMINHVATERVYVVDVNIKVCFEAGSGSSCYQEITVLEDTRIQYPNCSTSGLESLPFDGLSLDFWEPEVCYFFNGTVLPRIFYIETTTVDIFTTEEMTTTAQTTTPEITTTPIITTTTITTVATTIIDGTDVTEGNMTDFTDANITYKTEAIETTTVEETTVITTTEATTTILTTTETFDYCIKLNFTDLGEESCEMKYDCTGVACCLAIDYLPGVRNTEIRLEIDTCGVNDTVEMTWTVERKTGTETFNGLAIGSTKQIDISSAFQLNVTFDDEHSKWFFVSVALRACEVSPFPGVCQTFQVLQSSGIAKNCHGLHFSARRRKRDTKDVSFRSRNLMSFDESDIDKDGTIEKLIFEEVVRRQIRIAKRSTTEPDVTNFKEGIKILLDRNATNEEIVTYVTQVRNYELQKRLNNLQSVDLGDGDRTTGQRAALKALGSSNPFSLYTSRETFDGMFNTPGDEAIFLMINSSGLPENQQSYVIGQGLSVNGTKLLAVKLANLTITDLRNIMDMRRLELMSVKELLTDIRDLTKSLYFDFYDELSSEGDNIFTSLDLTLTGTLDFPRQDVQAMEYTKDFLLGGLVPMKFDFSVGGYYGMKFSVDASLSGMTVTSGIQPFGGAVVSGELQVGYAMSAVLKLEGQILELKFPTVAEITYNKFPLDVGVEMTLKLTPTRLSLNGAVTLNVNLLVESFNKELYRNQLWYYSTPTIEKKVVNERRREPDNTPPVISSYIGQMDKVLLEEITTIQCYVRQIANRDYTQPLFEISVHAEDDKSLVQLTLDVGTAPGGDDVLLAFKLGGPSTILNKPLTVTGVPLYFTVWAENSSGQKSKVTCSLLTYDISEPTGRLTADFITTSNPAVLRAFVVITEDSALTLTQIGVGYGKGLYGDQTVPWTDVTVETAELSVSPADDPDNIKVLDIFTGPRIGRLVAPMLQPGIYKPTAGDCARACADMHSSECPSFNYDLLLGNCELLTSVEGGQYFLAASSLYRHYQRLGVGNIANFVYTDLNLQDNVLYYFNFHMVNSLGYESYISSEAVMVDLTSPEPGEVYNVSSDSTETVPCLDLIPSDRPDWKVWCLGVNSAVKNHRIVVDGPGSLTVFNGLVFMNDLTYTRANQYIAVNWVGFSDKESGILGYTVAVGTAVCQDDIYGHHDPQSHLFDASQWINSALISPVLLSDNNYYITVRALNNVTYGGPLATSVCHSTPYTIDNSPPIIHEIFNIQYDEENYTISLEHISSDPQSGLAYVELCLGRSKQDCLEMDWVRFGYSTKINHTIQISDGIPIYVKIKVVSTVDLRAIKSADDYIIVDRTAPVAGQVYDGSVLTVDQSFTNVNDKICLNWKNFVDLESSISHYMISVGTELDKSITDVVNLTRYESTVTQACIDLEPDSYLQHDQTYYSTVWALNSASKQQNVSKTSNGILYDETQPLAGDVIDGTQSGFVDLEYSSSSARVEGQWRAFSDPESDITQYAVQVLGAGDLSHDYEVIKDWVQYPSDTASVSWLNLDLEHKDRVKVNVKATNGAQNTVTAESDGFVVDLTPPELMYIGDGTVAQEDVKYQGSTTEVSANFKFSDPESELDRFQIQIYEKYQRTRRQIFPVTVGEWHNIMDNSKIDYTHTALTLNPGGRYSMKIGAVNKAGAITAFETDGVIIDNSAPTIQSLKVGPLTGGYEVVMSGFVKQADTQGIQAAWSGVDSQSGISGYQVAVGTTSGGTETLIWTDYGMNTGAYIDGLTLALTSVYYVSVKVQNGAEMWSNVVTSTPVQIIGGSKKGVIIDGADGTENGIMGNDIDVTLDVTTVTIQFDGFTSDDQGIMGYEWAVGTSQGGEELQGFTKQGIVMKEETSIVGNGIGGSGTAQNILSLEPGMTYYTTVRAITNDGSVIQAESDGVLVDRTPPTISFDSLSGHAASDKNITEGGTQYQTTSTIYGQWSFNDTETAIERAWLSVSTYPGADDISPRSEVNVSALGEGNLPLGAITPQTSGKPNILNLWVQNSVGLMSTASSAAVVIDTTPPDIGIVTCPTFVSAYGQVKCTWTGFVDKQSGIVKYVVTMGSSEGSHDMFNGQEVDGVTNTFNFNNVSQFMVQDQPYYVTVTAVNYVAMETYSFSDPIRIDTTPPSYGKVIDLYTTYRVDAANATKTVQMNTKICNSDNDCDALDAICTETFSTVSVTWQPFTDQESGIAGYEMAVGITPGGAQIQAFTAVPAGALYYTIGGLSMSGNTIIYVSIKGINGAGLSSITSSDGVYLSYVSQGLFALESIFTLFPFISDLFP
ncbi:uncharacterized protein LOC143057371 [Mytilus galloprovincialis]|uniref:uncharacterized protein LOC143057371 n=1 Tax=Mytilus galloprovincialis TaxID=29158 RepID=UPI003F7B67AD